MGAGRDPVPHVPRARLDRWRSSCARSGSWSASASCSAAWIAGSYGERDRRAPRGDLPDGHPPGRSPASSAPRLTWVVANWDQIDDAARPHRRVGGRAAVLRRVRRRHHRRRPDRAEVAAAADVADGSTAYALGARRSAWPSAGSAAPRSASTSGRTWGASLFPPTVRYEGGDVREPSLGDRPLVERHGVPQHRALRVPLPCSSCSSCCGGCCERRPPIVPGTAIGDLLHRATASPRFLLDFLRVNDERVAGLTGAQWACIGTFAVGVWILVYWRPRNARLVEAETGARGAASRRGRRLGAEATGDRGSDAAGRGRAARPRRRPGRRPRRGRARRAEQVGHDPQHPLHERAATACRPGSARACSAGLPMTLANSRATLK